MLLVPAAVTTATSSLPNLALAGTLHLIRVGLQEMYLAHFTVPILTQFVPRDLPKLLEALKLRRKEVTRKYQDLLDSFYSEHY